MKKLKENIKRQAAREGKRFAYVVLGFVTGRAVAEGINWLATKFPEHEDVFKYSKAPLLGATGFLLSAASNQDAEFLRHFGYGVTGSAAFEGIKITPVAKDYLSGVGESMERTYYREGDKGALDLGNFGIHALPIKSIEMGEVQPIQVDLPELEGAGGGMGYSGSITSDADTKGII